jgi:hypothetical protein
MTINCCRAEGRGATLEPVEPPKKLLRDFRLACVFNTVAPRNWGSRKALVIHSFCVKDL